MMNISAMEMAVIAVIALIVLGPAKLPTMAKQFGRGMREFRGALSGNALTDDDRPERGRTDDADAAPTAPNAS